MVEAFAAVREAAKRTVDMRPFDVQLVGGVVLHQGKVAEMKTGEGKTLVATMPIYLNALLGRGVHLVTVNDYLARRDSLWMGAVYHYMGLSVGLLQSGAEQPAYLYDPTYRRDPYPGLRPVPRQEAYKADVTYGTNNEFGFDYLRDNLALSLDRRVQRPLYYAIVDEVDNIFIDEARTPLIISGPSGESVEDYSRFAAIARKLQPEVHYELDEKERSVYLTDAGLSVIEEETGIENIYDEANYRFVHYMQQALKAQVLFLEGRDYIRQRKQVILIDQHTGRLMPNRRLSEGLHQAIEAKEGVPIRPRDVTSATITIQNYFRMYEKLAGMSGTAITESEEFFKIYNLEVVVIPTNMPVIREDHADVVYRSEEAKLRAVAREILSCHSQGQPVLVGTTSVDMSERLSRRLTAERLQMAAIAPRVAYALLDADLERDERVSLREIMNDSLETMNSASWRRLVRAVGLEPNALSADNQVWLADYMDLGDNSDARRALERALRDGIPHEILNAKEHTREAAIIARAGEPGAVTIATNMAGRGVDIKLGGELSDEVIHKAFEALKARGLDPYTAIPAQIDSAIAEVAPQYAKRRDKVLDAAGLHVLGTERHEARRIDNQLRGRSGRQGEPGSSRFYLSLEDDLMRRFGRKEMLSKLMEQIGDDFPIEHGLVSKTIERAQTSVEGYNFDIRKHLLEYDDVLNRQRETIYDERLRVLRGEDLRAEVWRMLEGEVDDYLSKYGEDSEQQPLLFAGLDDIVPLYIPAPSAPFQGPLGFGGHLTAFPPFTISFIADQLSGQPLPQAKDARRDLILRAARSYGKQARQMVAGIAQATLDKYEERLDRYRALLDEKIEDYLQLVEERGQPADARRLFQYLERTYPLKLSTPQDSYSLDLDDLREHWLAEIEVEFHRQICAALLDRVQIRLPADIRLDRLRPARIPADKLPEEMQRVRKLAINQLPDEQAQHHLEQLPLPADGDASQVLAFTLTIKENSGLDIGRLDRIVGHVLGAYLDELLETYLDATPDTDGRLQRDLERLRDSVMEGKKGRRAGDLVGILRELNDLVHLEIPALEDLLSQAVAHEYDKWAQRQVDEIEAEATRHPLVDTTWTAVAEHLLSTVYTQRQAYDRDHRRRTTWMPRLPLAYLGQAQIEGLDAEEGREAILSSLGWSLEQREQAWGQQELQRWGHLILNGLDEEAYDGLLRFLGERELGDLAETPVDSLPADLSERLRFVLALHRLEEENLRLGDLPQSEQVIDSLVQALKQRIVDVPMAGLGSEMRDWISQHLREAGLLDDPAARSRLLDRPVRSWDPQPREAVASFLGRRFIDDEASQQLDGLDPGPRAVAIAYLQDQHRFVDEQQVQRFLVHQRLSDLPAETEAAALQHLARTRLERQSKRKISNLDVHTRQVVIESLQRMGRFTDQARRDELLSQTLADLQTEVRSGFEIYVGRMETADRRLTDLEPDARTRVFERLKQSDALVDESRISELEQLRLTDLDESVASQVRDDLIDEVRADLAAKTMEELSTDRRQLVHRALEEQNYFVDRERVAWYERNTLAQLPSDLLRGLEMHLGSIRFKELADIPFRDLPLELRESLESFFDSSGLFSDRAERLRLTQTDSLGALAEESRSPVIQHLGRQRLVQLRDQRPPSMATDAREAVWVYLRSQGYFTDEFKEELFAYQRLDEFGKDTYQAVESAVMGQLSAALESQPIGNMSARLQTKIRTLLGQAEYFVDTARLKQVEDTLVQDLPSELGSAVESAVGSFLLADQDTTPLAELPSEVRTQLWRYLDTVGYLVDEKKRSQILDHTLTDLKSDVYENVVADLAAHLASEIGGQAVSELDDDLRQGLREALEELGYFESDQVRTRTLAQPLGGLRREDREALSVRFGLAQLDSGTDRMLSDLPKEDYEAIVNHMQEQGWFLDQSRVDQLLTQSMSSLDQNLRRMLLESLRHQQAASLRDKRLADLDREQKQAVHQLLQQQGLALEESHMRQWRRQSLSEIDPKVYRQLLRHLGEEVALGWDSTTFQNLSTEDQALIVAYLGRRIMGRIERRVLLHTINRLWIDYLTDIEDLRRGIGLEAYGQRDPLVEYKRRAFELFEELGDNIRKTAVRSLFRQVPEPLQT
jgi:preprotein translocase subunit SecA